MGIGKIFNKRKRQANWSIKTFIRNINVNRKKVFLIIYYLFLHSFCLYVSASLLGFLPEAWMSVCTVRDSILIKSKNLYLNERYVLFQLVLHQKFFNFEQFFRIKVLVKSVELVGQLLLTLILVWYTLFILFFSFNLI
jgi:hypothetical protein